MGSGGATTLLSPGRRLEGAAVPGLSRAAPRARFSRSVLRIGGRSERFDFVLARCVSRPSLAVGQCVAEDKVT